MMNKFKLKITRLKEFRIIINRVKNVLKNKAQNTNQLIIIMMIEICILNKIIIFRYQKLNDYSLLGLLYEFVGLFFFFKFF